MITQKCLETIVFVFEYAHDVDDWMRIKRELLKLLPSIERKYFSTRDPITKKQSMNDYEMSISKKWEELSGRKVVFNTHEEK
jgi:hypothetical protein